MEFHLTLLLISTLIAFSNGSCLRNLTSVTFDDKFSKLFNYNNVNVTANGTSVYLSLDEPTGGSGFISQDNYTNGLFSASIKLPSPSYTAGVVVTYYLSNNLTQHDEIDFEFLGHVEGQGWILQTNFFGNGSTNRGREERYKLWFDPSEEFHQYAVFWGETRLVYYVDSVPIRIVNRVENMGGDYPSKPMYMYATIWDGSGWATGGGQYKINHTFDPFIAGYSDLVLNGCSSNPPQIPSYCGGSEYMKICGEVTPVELRLYEAFRNKYMTYSYCQDKGRYNPPLPECLVSFKSVGSP